MFKQESETSRHELICPHCYAVLADARDPYSVDSLFAGDNGIDLFVDGAKHKGLECPECGQGFDLEIRSFFEYTTTSHEEDEDGEEE